MAMSRALLALLAPLLVAASGLGAAVPDEEEVSLLQTVIEQKPGNSSSSSQQLGNSSSAQAQSTEMSSAYPAVQPDNVFHNDLISDGNAGTAPPPPSPSPAVSPPSAVLPSPWDSFKMRNVVAEYVAMTFFVVIGCGSAMVIAKEEGSAWVLQVALAFGFAITVLAYSLGRYSGGQINCAVTLALWVYGDLEWPQALFNFCAQMLGSVTGAILLCIMIPKTKDRTGSIGSNAIAEGHGPFRVLVGELLMTFLLVLVVFESGKASGPASGIAVICIGLAVFLAHCVLIPVDGCSINPTRSFGPALIATLRDGKADHFDGMVIFWLGPLLGALIGAGVHKLFQL